MIEKNLPPVKTEIQLPVLGRTFQILHVLNLTEFLKVVEENESIDN
jgi:hypothetical protein